MRKKNHKKHQIQQDQMNSVVNHYRIKGQALKSYDTNLD